MALKRLAEAFAMAGFDQIEMVHEPVAAASQYEADLGQDQRILVADFGGGTTDLCVMKVGPKAQSLSDQERILGIDGVGLAGDALDGRVVYSWLCPHLGLGSTYKSEFGQVYTVPSWPYHSMMRWHHVAMLNEKKTLRQLHEVAVRAREPKKIRALIDCVEQEMGFLIYKAVEAGKIALSSEERALFSFCELEDPIEEDLSRMMFETWVAEELHAIEACCDRLLERLGLDPGEIDRVFMTGGTAFVPAVQQIFRSRFGKDKMGGGAELTSVVSGLAQIARRRA